MFLVLETVAVAGDNSATLMQKPSVYFEDGRYLKNKVPKEKKLNIFRFCYL
jgi:hypothetical protein